LSRSTFTIAIGVLRCQRKVATVVGTNAAEEETDDADLAYARFPESEPTRYRDGWLPSS
jgi:hypothetical protein